jgi:hypothetical protein
LTSCWPKAKKSPNKDSAEVVVAHPVGKKVVAVADKKPAVALEMRRMSLLLKTIHLMRPSSTLTMQFLWSFTPLGVDIARL